MTDKAAKPGPEETRRVLVSVCLCTYRRAHLTETLGSLNTLSLPDGVDLEIIVVDNDAEGSGRAAVDALRPAMRFPVTYDIEPRQGIADARNRTLALAQGDWLAFLDDDEIADPDWIAAHYGAAQALHADVLVGPVETAYEAEPPVWAVKGQFFDREPMQTGAPVSVARTGNAFVRAALVREHGIKFNTDYSRTGGEDVFFFQMLKSRGARMFSCAEARVAETLPKDRMSMEYLLERVYTQGQSYARTFQMGRGRMAWLGALADTLFKLAVTGVLMTVLKPFNDTFARRMRLIWSCNLGKLQILRGNKPKTFYH